MDWANDYWKPLFNYIPTISLLSNGWIVFVFLEPEHCTQALEGIWRIGKGSLVLGRWHSNFDPLRERITKRHLWVLLPHLPFPLWNRQILEGIGDTIGRFISVEDDFHLIFDKRVAKILVELDISRGLPTEVEILCKDRLLIQKLDYLHVPFRCNSCRSVGHLRNTCPLRLSDEISSNTEVPGLVSPPASPDTSSHPPPSPSLLSSQPPQQVPESFFEAVDNLILSHRLSGPPDI